MATLHHKGKYGTSFWEIICPACNQSFLLENFGTPPSNKIFDLVICPSHRIKTEKDD